MSSPMIDFELNIPIVKVFDVAADDEKPPEEAYTLADANPKNEKIVSINTAVG